MKTFTQKYHKKCTFCKSHIDIDTPKRVAVWAVSRQRCGHTQLVYRTKKTRRGDRYGTLHVVVWMCPNCGHTHQDKFWTPADQTDMFGAFGL